MREIPLTRGYVALVDDEDFDWLSQWKWRALFNGRRFYAVRTRWPDPVSLLMHREIVGPTFGVIDHINLNSLDNRRENLRECTVSQNCCNRGRPSNNTSGFKGVYYDKRRSKWFASAQINGRNKFGGYFDNPSDAARAYDELAKKWYGEFAYLNFLEEGLSE